jgi:CRP-like cAMP-binding protein
MPIDLFRVLEAIAIATPVAKGSFVFSSGDPASAVFVVRTGKVALIWADSNEVYPFDTFGPGTILGLPAALNGEYSATARAVEDSELGFIPADRVLEMLERNPTHMHARLPLLRQRTISMTPLDSDPIKRPAHSSQIVEWNGNTPELPGHTK